MATAKVKVSTWLASKESKLIVSLFVGGVSVTGGWGLFVGKVSVTGGSVLLAGELFSQA
ncbi:hypothetical protein AGMMS4956_04720 [Bacteroidia bacterium]|nr:hypothetical protein AGMMS4956_04720 [Bacteroidia bacterium]